MGNFILPAIKTDYKYPVIKSILYWQIDKYIDQLAQKQTHTSPDICYLKEQAT